MNKEGTMEIKKFDSQELNHFVAKTDNSLYDNFRHMSLRMQEDYYCLMESDKILNILTTQIDPKNDKIVWIKGISTHQDFKNKGYGQMMIEHLMQIAKEQNLSIRLTSYSSDGFTRLYDKFTQLKEKYGVTVIEPENLKTHLEQRAAKKPKM